MFSSSPSDSKPCRRRGKASIAILTASLVLAGGGQALVPAPAGAYISSEACDEWLDCTDQGQDEGDQQGQDGGDQQGQDGGDQGQDGGDQQGQDGGDQETGEIPTSGSEVIEVFGSSPPSDSPSSCEQLWPACLPSGSNSGGSAPAPDPNNYIDIGFGSSGGSTSTPTPGKKECLALLMELTDSDRYPNARALENDLRGEIEKLEARRLRVAKDLAPDMPSDLPHEKRAFRESEWRYLRLLTQQIRALEQRIRSAKYAERQFDQKQCDRVAYGT